MRSPPGIFGPFKPLPLGVAQNSFSNSQKTLERDCKICRFFEEQRKQIEGRFLAFKFIMNAIWHSVPLSQLPSTPHVSHEGQCSATSFGAMFDMWWNRGSVTVSNLVSLLCNTTISYVTHVDDVTRNISRAVFFPTTYFCSNGWINYLSWTTSLFILVWP